MSNKDKLTPKQRLFVTEYCKDFNATAAYLRAGYAKTGARQSAFNLLTKTDISREIKAHIEKIEEKAVVTEAMVLNGLLAETKEMEDGSSSTRITAWSQLGKTLAMFIEKKEIDATVSVESEVKRMLDD